jgi:hypothetical protein
MINEKEKLQTHDLSYNGMVPVRVGGQGPPNSRPDSNHREKNNSVVNSTSTPLNNAGQ